LLHVHVLGSNASRPASFNTTACSSQSSSPPTKNSAVSSPTATPAANARLADQWVASAILDCLDASSPRKPNLLDASPPELLSSGRALLARLASSYLVRTGAELRAAEQAFADYKPFRVGMSPDEVEFAARDAINRYKRLPAFNATDALALHKMLLEKLPDSIATHREEAINKLHEEAIKGRVEWTIEQLLIAIASWLRSPSRAQLSGAAASALVAEACAAVVDEELEADAIACAASRPRPRPSRDGCFICGRSGCSIRVCKLKCNTCGDKLCPGARPPNPCVVVASSRPERENIRNALGTVVSTRIHEHLVALWEQRRKQRIAQTHAASADPAIIDAQRDRGRLG
jgi:hypothetical protein